MGAPTLDIIRHIREHQDPAHYQDLHWEGTFADYLTLVSDNPRIARVVVTTRDGRRTVKVYSKTGEERDVPEAVGDALTATGDKIADAAGWVADNAVDKTKEGLNEVGDKAEDVGDKAKSVGREVGDKAEDVGDKAASTAKTAGKKTVSGAKKAGSKIKKVVDP